MMGKVPGRVVGAAIPANVVSDDVIAPRKGRQLVVPLAGIGDAGVNENERMAGTDRFNVEATVRDFDVAFSHDADTVNNRRVLRPANDVDILLMI
jgi:hypothetical protein